MHRLSDYLRNNWFRIAIAILLIFIALKKDITFHMDVNAPVQPASPEVPFQQQKEKVQERFTENFFSKKRRTTPAKTMERLDLQPFSKGQDDVALKELSGISSSIRGAFIERFMKVALAEQKNFGIPASIVLGNALLISRAGESEGVQKGLNFFALPCTEDWQGEQGNIQGKCYRHYESAWMSFRDHSLYITTGKFSSMRALRNEDFSAWAVALEKEGFVPVPHYARQVLQVIQEYQLNRWDN